MNFCGLRLSLFRWVLPQQAPAALFAMNQALWLTTVVHVNNVLGRLYMLPVAPMHRLIAPAVLRAVART